jgi:hypothetical protein
VSVNTTYTPSPEYAAMIARRKLAAERLGVSPTMRGQIVKARTPYIDEFTDRPADPFQERFSVKGVQN